MRVSNKAVAVAFVLSMAVAPASHAADYFGVTVGSSHYDIDFPGVIHGFDQEHSQATGLVLGRTYDWYSIEGQYAHLGSFSIANSTDATFVTVQSVSLSFIPTYKFMYAKVGAEWWQMNETFDGTPTSKSGFGPLVGVGLRFDFNEHVEVRVGFDKHLGVSDVRVDGKPGVDVTYVGLMYKF